MSANTVDTRVIRRHRLVAGVESRPLENAVSDGILPGFGQLPGLLHDASASAARRLAAASYGNRQRKAAGYNSRIAKQIL